MRKSFYILILLIAVVACQKENNGDLSQGKCRNYSTGSSVTYPSGPFSFTKLEAVPTTIQKGTLAKVVATVTGSHLTFTWSTPHGDIFGNGAEVYYGDSCLGTYDVNCTVSDGTNSVTKTVSITITN